jgi:hypothetical protein
MCLFMNGSIALLYIIGRQRFVSRAVYAAVSRIGSLERRLRDQTTFKWLLPNPSGSGPPRQVVDVGATLLIVWSLLSRPAGICRHSAGVSET